MGASQNILTQTFCQVEITMYVLLIKRLLPTYTSILLQRQSDLCRVLLIAIGDMCACLKSVPIDNALCDAC